jgi:NitT/TauT family transport system substrate-binding protein
LRLLPPKEAVKLQHVVIDEAVHTLLYLPIYHAIERGYFKDEGLDVELVTGGTATNAFSAMTTGSADFAVADPMYVPISRQSGADTKVVGQVVGRIAVWALTKDPAIHSFDRASIQGKKIATHQRPMTAYTYTENYLAGLGLKDGQGVDIVQARPGTEVVPFLAGQADFVVTLEPGASTAEAAGAHVVYSWPTALGDQIFTGLMVRQQTIAQHRAMVVGAVRALYRSLADLRDNKAAALVTARKYFPQVDEHVLTLAIDRLTREHVFPDTPAISVSSWDRAVKARQAAGDLKGAAPYNENVDKGLISAALSK